MSTPTPPQLPHHPHHPMNVRGLLVGDEDAEQPGIDHKRRTALAATWLGVLMLLMAVAVLVQAARLPDTPGPVGPASGPWLVGTLLFLVGALIVRSGRQGLGVWKASERTTSQDWQRMLALLVALVLFAVAMPLVGYVVASTFLFGTTATVLGSPHRLRSFAYGWCVSAVVFLAFDTAIGLSLPAGPWGF